MSKLHFTAPSDIGIVSPSDSAFGPLRILIAHRPSLDCSDLLGALAAVCANLDLRTVFYVQRIIETLGNRTVDCVFIDSQLAGFNNGKFLDELRRLGIDTPVVVLRDASKATSIPEGGGPTTELNLGKIDAPQLAAALNRALADAPAAAAQSAVAPTSPRTSHALSAAEIHSGLDALTGLAGRGAFFECLRHAIQKSRVTQEPVGLLILDLDDFKSVNRDYGHDVGDLMLGLAARRLKETVGPDNLLARIGNDEFAVLLSDVPGGDYEKVAENVRQAIAAPAQLGEQEFSPHCTIGAAIHPWHGATAESLFQAAEMAMAAAKRNGSGLGVFGAGEATADAERILMVQDLRRALQGNQLELYYQPKIDMMRRRIVGVEALLRWKHPTHGFISPDVFVPLSEQYGMIDQLTQWVLNASLEQMKRWREMKIDLLMSVNLSAVTLHNLEFPATIAAALKKWRIEPQRLVLEVTESAIILDSARAVEIISRLDAMGMSVSVDDFGTGYTSLAYIRRLPIREIKIDKSFILNMRENADDAVIVRTIIELGHSLGLEVVAEGIEDAITYDLLTALNCDLGQGYFMGRPVPAVGLESWLKDSPFNDRLQASLPLTAAG